MILVDTSVWIAYFRGSDKRLVMRLQTLLEEDLVALGVPVKIEILSGSSARDLPRLRGVLSALPVILPSTGTWARIEDWVETATRKGERFGFADLLVAALASERGMLLWSLDRDFQRLQKLGFLRMYTPE